MAITGSVQQKNNRWYCVVSYRDENNKRKQKWINTGLTIKGNKRAAEKILREKIAEMEQAENEKTVAELKEVEKPIEETKADAAVNPVCNITVAEWFIEWLTDIEKKVRPNTFRGYKGNMTNHIIPYFEEKKIIMCDVTYKDIQAYYDYKASSKLSATSIRHHAENMSKAFEDGIMKNKITVNPTKRAKPPKVKKYKATFLNRQEVEELLHLFKDNVVELPVILCSIYGFRRSEVLGLRWENVDFVKRTIYIVETLQQNTGGDYVDDTKSEDSTRTMPITERAYTLLLAKRQEQEQMKKLMGKHYTDSDYVCTWKDGKIIKPNYLSSTFHAVVVSHQFKKVRLHDLRHSAATNLLEMGFTVAQVAEWLGHSSPEVTLKYYAHATKQSKMQIANALDSMFDAV